MALMALRVRAARTTITTIITAIIIVSYMMPAEEGQSLQRLSNKEGCLVKGSPDLYKSPAKLTIAL